ncbi:uncharacterized protein ARMOST_18471 [Armillaria ostoyae]|uniref:Uncharacterized protein n=1 Tax=Armillaria ostoyae TaxID=47428 RepID=A0A284S1U6_ARMOS|nr:uncharacterized protein ARMOST_18471 [Armillaria ostoyae]
MSPKTVSKVNFLAESETSLEDDDEWEDDIRDTTAEEIPPAKTEASELLSRISRGPAAMPKKAPTSTARFGSQKKCRTLEEIRRQRRRRQAATTPEYFDGPIWFGGMLKGISFAFRYTLDAVWHQTVRFFRRPLSFLAILWVLAFLFGKTSKALQVVVQPLCFILGIPHSSLCVSRPHHTRVPKHADFPALVEIQSATFEQLLDDFVHVSLLSLNVKKAEMAVSELNEIIHRVKYQNDEHFTASLSNFIGTAKETAIELQILSFHVQDTVDRIVVANNHSISTIDGAHRKDVQYSLHSLIPWSSPSSDEMILKIFSESIDMLSQISEILILKAQVQWKNLEDLQGSLIVVRDIIVRDNLEVPADCPNELVWELVHHHGLTVLNYVDEYLQPAPRHVSSALHMLHEMSGNIAALRERVAEPPPSGSSIPPEVHMNSIKRGLETLEASNREARERERDARRLLV